MIYHGIYSLDTYSIEESVTKDFLKKGNVDFIINIVDASLLERSLYLTLELLKLNIPIIIVLNKIDVLRKNKVNIDIIKLQKILNVTMLPISASNGKGLNNVLDELLKGENEKYTKDSKIEFNKFKYIDNIIRECVTKQQNITNLTDVLDNVILNKFLGIPIFLIIMFILFYLTFSIGNIANELLEKLIEAIANNSLVILNNMNIDKSLISLIVDGIIPGVGSILVFIPNLLVLFLLLAILEDSGYMARVTYIMNETMKKFGLPGKGIIPLILGFGCSVPAVMSTRILENYKDRFKIMMIIPFMSCYAKIPIYVLISQTFFGKNSSVLSFMMYIFRYNFCINNDVDFKKYI